MSRYRQTMTEALKQVYKEQDEKDHEISMARGELEAIADKATQLSAALQGKSDDGNPLEAWVQSKITKAKDYINSVSDYMMYKPENAKEEVELEEKNTDKYVWSDINTAMMRAGFSPGMIMKVLSGLRGKELSEELEEAKIISDISGVSINKLKQEVMPFSVKVGKVGPGMDSDYEVEFTGSEPNLIKYAKKHLDFDGNNFSQLKKHLAMEETEVNEKTYGWTLVSKAKDLAKKFADNMTKAVQEIEKLEKGLSKNPVVYKELIKYNEETDIDESKISDIFKSNKEGESIEDIAKRLKLSPSMVKKLLGEAKDEKEVPKGYHKMPDGTVMKDSEHKKDDKKEENDKEKEVASKDKEIESLRAQVALLKQKFENEKNKAIKPEPNPKTGEVPLTIGIAHAEFKKDKEKEQVKEENLEELSKAERDKRIQRAKDMIKYYDAQKKAALKGPNKALAKKMLKNETELEEGTKPTDFKVKMKTPSGMKMVKVTIPVKDFKVDMAAIEDAARKKVNGNMIDFDFVGDLKMGESQVKEETLDEFTSSMIKDLQKSYADLKGKTISPEKANALSKHLDRLDTTQLKQLVKANIPFVSTVARNKVYKKTGKFEELEESKDMDKHFKTLSNKVQSKVNELLRTGMGYWDAVEKAKKMFNEDRRLYVEAIAGLQKKADKSGMPYSVLKQVYDRGMAAWKSGHRPGASQQQWAFARVNSFITKSSGTWGGADKDLAAKVKGSK